MSALKIRSNSMLGTSHSWSVTMRNLLKAFEEQGHDLYLNSINEYELVPKSWDKFIKKECIDADIDICYTLPRNFGRRFNANSKLKLAIYNYETSIMPSVWVPQIKKVDYVLPSSSFSKKVFVDSGWPAEKCVVVPHGISLKDFDNKEKVNNLRTNRKFKFLNISIPHYRKNIGLLVSAYYKAFTAEEDVCLVIKTSLDPPSRSKRFECDVTKEIQKVQKSSENRKRPLPQLELLSYKYDNIIPLYNTCDCLVSASSAEGFGLPLLEALAAGLIVVAPRCTGQLDFLNDKNSLLVNANEIKASPKYQYWHPSPGAKTFLPEVDSLAENMRKAYDDYNELKTLFEDERNKVINKFTWTNAANKILELV